MPYFKNSPPAKAILIEQGWPVYLFGSRQSIDAEMHITSVAIASNVATVGVTGWSGPLPVVGAFASIEKTQTNSGLFNVTNQTITAVNVDQTGTGTVSFALTNANIGTTPDVGNLRIRFAPVGETLTADGGASIAGSVKYGIGRDENWLTAQVYFPTAPSAATVALQGSNTNNDADFSDIGTITIANGRGSKDFQTNFEFVRFNITGVTGTGTVVASINA